MLEVFLSQSQIFSDIRPHRLSTVLGSCVAVCLWDQRLKFGGMNHYMLPMWNGAGLASPKYGNIAIPKLIEQMNALGGNSQDYIAKVFGGGNVMGDEDKPYIYQIGTRNAEHAIHMLTYENIPVVAQKLRPNNGLKITMDTGTGEVLVRNVRRLSDIS
jgi:chemotaxis protein CheD